MKYILYNSLSNNGIKNEKMETMMNEDNVVIKDMKDLNYKEFFNSLNQSDVIKMFGGDGTINYLINAINEDDLKNDLYLVPSGTGNDFFNDVVEDKNVTEVLLNPYLKNLPIVYVNGMTKKFINGIGFGIDGYCCEEGDKLKEKSDKPVNYTSIAIKGLLFHFKPVNAKVKVDGVEYNYQHVWLAPTMKGRFYGGGMMIAPNQNRNDEKVVSTVVYMTKSKFKALTTFPSIFKGEHIKKEKMVKIFKGQVVEVEFDRPTALQIDGETVKNVLSYKVVA